MAEPVPRMRRSTERSEVMFLSADQKAVAAKPGSGVSVAALHVAPHAGHERLVREKQKGRLAPAFSLIS